MLAGIRDRLDILTWQHLRDRILSGEHKETILEEARKVLRRIIPDRDDSYYEHVIRGMLRFSESAESNGKPSTTT
jgi:hypothetical protein